MKRLGWKWWIVWEIPIGNREWYFSIVAFGEINDGCLLWQGLSPEADLLPPASLESSNQSKAPPLPQDRLPGGGGRSKCQSWRQSSKKVMLAICDFREATLALQLTSWLGSSSSLAEAGSAPLENTMCVSRSKATWPFGCESFEEKKRLMKSEEQGQYFCFINWYFPHWQFHVGESFWAPGDVHRPQPGHRQSGRCCSQWKDPRCDQWETPHTWRNVQDVLGQDNWTSKASKDGLSFKKCANVGMKTDLLRPDWAA